MTWSKNLIDRWISNETIQEMNSIEWYPFGRKFTLFNGVYRSNEREYILFTCQMNAISITDKVINEKKCAIDDSMLMKDKMTIRKQSSETGYVLNENESNQSQIN